MAQFLDPYTPGAPGTPLGRKLARRACWRRRHALSPDQRAAVWLTSLLWIWTHYLVFRFFIF